MYDYCLYDGEGRCALYLRRREMPGHDVFAKRIEKTEAGGSESRQARRAEEDCRRQRNRVRRTELRHKKESTLFTPPGEDGADNVRMTMCG